MGTVASYLLANIFYSCGYPKRRGILRKLVVSPKICDFAVIHLCRVGVSLGAGRPELALSLITEVFRDRPDWSEKSVSELIEFLNVDNQVSSSIERPWEGIAPSRFSTTAEQDGLKDLPWNALAAPEIAFHYTGAFAQSLMWGILNSSEAERAIQNYLSDISQRFEFWKKYGFKLSEPIPESLSEYYESIVSLISAYEDSVGGLLIPPDGLLNHPELAPKLRRKQDNPMAGVQFLESAADKAYLVPLQSGFDG